MLIRYSIYYIFFLKEKDKNGIREMYGLRIISIALSLFFESKIMAYFFNQIYYIKCKGEIYFNNKAENNYNLV